MRLLLFAFILGTSSALAGQVPESCKPVPKHHGWWKNLNARRVRHVKNNPPDLIFIGDSITHSWEKEGRNVWAKYYAHRNAANLGIAADRTQHCLWRMQNGSLDYGKPKVAVLMIGTNNFLQTNGSVEDTYAGIVANVKAIRKKLPKTKILVLGVLPFGRHFKPPWKKIIELNKKLAKLPSKHKRVYYLHFGDKYIGKNNAIPKTLMYDLIHLTEAGFKIWAESMEETLSKHLKDKPVKP